MMNEITHMDTVFGIGEPSYWQTNDAMPEVRPDERLTPVEIGMMPTIFRLTSIRRSDTGHGKVQYTASLFHDSASVKVRWQARKSDLKMKSGDLVSPRWNRETRSDADGAILISRLVLMERPEASVNLFETVPHGWVGKRDLVREAVALLDSLPQTYRHLFNAVFWDGMRFRKFCTVPSSMNGHHMEDHGNLRHAVEVASMMRRHGEGSTGANAALSVLAGLLHDAGKAEEYFLNRNGEWRLTDRGKLLGHGVTVVEWIAVAMTKSGMLMPERDYVALLHCLTCSANAPDYLGIRRPAMMEAHLLSGMDRLSGTSDLMLRCTTEQPGWGAYHPHLKGRPYGLERGAL